MTEPPRAFEQNPGVSGNRVTEEQLARWGLFDSRMS